MGLNVEISAGELVDKITILEIKLQFIEDEAKQKNVHKELAALKASYQEYIGTRDDVRGVQDQLKKINLELWKIEDDIRECERQSDFGDNFITLARAVYHTNDKRADLKRQINVLTDSELIEEKSYAAY